MDDLDHSIHIAEYDWRSFYDDSEECDLLQASLAYPDDSGLSDSEDSGNFNTIQQETSKSAEESCAGGTQLPGRPVQSDATCMKRGEICVGCPDRNAIPTASAHKEVTQEILAETSDSSATPPQTDSLSNYTSRGRETLSKDEATQMTGDLKSTKKPDLLSYKEAAPSLSGPEPTAREAEKERWFVTVNDNPARRRGRPASVKKKLKPNKTGERENVQNADLKQEQEQSKDAPSNQSEESGDLSEETVISQTVAVMSRDQSEPGSSADTSYDSFSPSPTVLERLQCSGLQDGAEFSSTGSWDSDSYLSAAESVEGAQHPPQDCLSKHLPLQCALSPTCDSQDFGLTLSSDATAANCEGCNTPAPPSAEVPDPNVPSGDDTCSETRPPPLLSAGSQEDQLGSLPGLDSTLSSAADNPETFAKAAGQARPVYAISAFWNEVEKLTINDILQVRMGRSSRLFDEIGMPNACGPPTDPGNLADALESTMIDTSDTADSDYFTQPDESKPDRSVCEFSTSDFEEESWQFASASTNPSPDLQSRTQQSDSPFLLDEDGSTDSEGRETPVTPDQSFDSQDFQSLLSWPRRMTKSRSVYNIQPLGTEELLPLPFLSTDKSILPLSTRQPLEAFLSHTDLQDYRISFPEIFEYFFTEYDNTESQFLTVRDPEDIFVSPVFRPSLFAFREDPASLQCSTEKPIPIFSCSHPTVRDLTFPNARVFLSADHEEAVRVSPMKLVSHSFIQAGAHRSSGAAGVGGSHCWKTFLSLRKIRFPGKGSICCSESGAWIFPVQSKELWIGGQNQAVALLSEGRVGLDFSQEFRELEEQQGVSETTWTTNREGIFSRVKQSDMCLVCIAFASWVLRSSNPEEADAWKAALLANVSALSAIQYLRQYMKMEHRPTDDL
ncbi:uncharacterized protein si:ch211-157b11.14 [Fundulus heteroclitus]|uniref:uncharacterized protein si:ch211-157b11.14 n=1 Tax=Fundulus heteroclitus TaxID=8078 RepID=UPI00165AC449|nr:uncharacterized protein si:ch211-157b11.14 [Fundulus heteroclitus]